MGLAGFRIIMALREGLSSRGEGKRNNDQPKLPSLNIST